MNDMNTTCPKIASTCLETGSRTALIVNEVVDSRQLLGSAGKVIIEHESMQYELRLTRQGKLLLTK